MNIIYIKKQRRKITKNKEQRTILAHVGQTSEVEYCASALLCLHSSHLTPMLRNPLTTITPSGCLTDVYLELTQTLCVFIGTVDPGAAFVWRLSPRVSLRQLPGTRCDLDFWQFASEVYVYAEREQ